MELDNPLAGRKKVRDLRILPFQPRRARLTSSQERPFSRERRQAPRYTADIPATVTIASEDCVFQADPGRARILDVGESGRGMRVVVETQAEHENVMSILAHPTACLVECRFPDNSHESELAGEIVWFEVDRQSGSLRIRLGISLRRTDEVELKDLCDYVEKLKTGMEDNP
jgi:hypothetical protein